MKKTYILDTSVLVDDPISFKTFKDSIVVIPITVIEELDKVKKQFGRRGMNARIAIKKLDDISNLGNIRSGVLLTEDNILLKIDPDHYVIDAGDPLYGDNRILACAYHYNQSNDVSLISNDLNLRIRARAIGIIAESYDKNNKFTSSELFMGAKIIVNEDAGSMLKNYNWINPEDYDLDLFNNEFVIFEDTSGTVLSYGRKVTKNKVKIVKNIYPWGISSKNKEQMFAIDLIMDPNIDLITLVGKAGTGKSLITLASALELVLNQKVYDKFIIYRPIQAFGNDIGFLPGQQDEKLAPWFEAIIDNFEVLFQSSYSKNAYGQNNKNWMKDFEMYKKNGRIEMQALTYIRGRSIPNSIILVDESQNLSKDEVKTILTRVGNGTKIILTGDIEQIDNENLDASNNGLVYVIEKFKNSDISGHVTFVQGERSRLASKAAEIL
jgi:PhoH-like ATPase